MASFKTVVQSRISWTQKQHYLKMGRHFGYPECCINQFLSKSGIDWWYMDLPFYANRTLKLSGYVPCEKCAHLPREVLVADINSRRKCEKLK